MGRPVTQHLTAPQAAGVAALYAETAAREAWLREHTAEVRFAVYLGDAKAAIGTMRRNAAEGRALLDVEAGGAWDEATGALRNAEHVFTREMRSVPVPAMLEVEAARAEVSALLREAGAVFTANRADDAEASEAYRVAQFARNAGNRRFAIAGRSF